MRKIRVVALILLLVSLVALTLPASAATTALDLQMNGGYVAIGGGDTYFFAPTSGTTWGLYSVNTFLSGPLYSLEAAQPTRMLYADSKQVVFLSQNPANNTYIVASLDIASKTALPLVDDIGILLAETDTTFFFVKASDPNTLYRHDISSGKTTTLKTMTSKSVVDSMTTGDKLYFLGTAKNGDYAVYDLNQRSWKAIAVDAPSPKMGIAFLADGKIVYSAKGDTTKVYTVTPGKAKATQIGKDVLNLNMSSPFYANAFYPIDTASNSIVYVPISGGATNTMPLVTPGVQSVIMGGSSDKLFYFDDGRIYSVTPNLTSKTELCEFTIDAGISYTSFAPTHANYLLALGYTEKSSSLPNAVRLIDLSSRQVVFTYPEPVPEVVEPEAPIAPELSGELPDLELEIDEDEDVSFSDIFQ